MVGKLALALTSKLMPLPGAVCSFLFLWADMFSLSSKIFIFIVLVRHSEETRALQGPKTTLP